MATFEIKDPTMELIATMTGALSIAGPKCRAILDAIYNLNLELPMVQYSITRVGSTDVWNVSATAQDERAYSSVVSIPSSTAYYTLTSLPAGTSNELANFLTLIQAWAVVLKAYAFSSVLIEWA